MTTLQSINTEIIGGNFSDADLNSIQDAIKFRRAQLVRKTIRTLTRGDAITFNSTRLGRNVQGTVQKVGRKFVTVSTTAGLWRVPANMLEHA